MNDDLPGSFSHLDAEGKAHMVDVGAKKETLRRALARADVRVSSTTDRALCVDALPKGSVQEVVRLAAMGGAKATGQLIPLCHPLRLTGLQVELRRVEEGLWRVEVEVSAVDRTGVEMEAMTGASIGALALYDMVKAVDRAAALDSVLLLRKEGGKSGRWIRQGEES